MRFRQSQQKQPYCWCNILKIDSFYLQRSPHLLNHLTVALQVNVQDPDVDFPTELVSMFDPESNQAVTIEKPVGRFCRRCSSACHSGMPYLNDSELENSLKDSPDTKALCIKVVDFHYSNEPVAPSTKTVESVDQCEDKLVCIRDGYFREDFPEAHQGCTPEDLKIVPKLYFTDASTEPIELFWVPGKPAFQLQSSLAVCSQMHTNQMPSMVYPDQPLHTHQYFSNTMQAPTRVRTMEVGPYVSRAALNKAIKDVVAARPGRGSEDRNIQAAGASSSTGAASNPFARAAPPAPKTPFQPKAPLPQVAQASAQKSVIFKTVKHESLPAPPPLGQMGPPMAAKSAPPTSAPRLFAAMKVKPEAGPAKTMASKTQRAATGPLPSAQQAPNVAGEISAAKRQRVESTPRSTTKDLTGGLRNVVAMDLAKVRAPTVDDVDTQSDSTEVKGASKWERAKIMTNIPRILMGENLEAHMVTLRKTRTMALRESPEEWYPVLEEHLNRCTGAQQIILVKMMIAQKFIDLLRIAIEVQRGLDGERLTKFAFVDLCLVYVAMQTLPPWVPVPDLMRLLERLPLIGEQDQPYDLEHPSLLTSMLDHDDLATGIVPQRFCHFIERYVLNAYIVAGPKYQDTVVDFLNDGLIPKLKALPETHATPCYENLMKRSLGLLCLFGPIPYLHDAQVVHAKFLKDDKNNIVSAAVRQAKWATRLMDCVNMVNVGEKIAWPQVMDFVATLEKAGNDTFDQKVSLIEGMIAKYPAWKKQVRQPALPKQLHPPVLRNLLELLAVKEQKCDDTKSVTFDAKDPEVYKLLKVFQSLQALEWCAPPLTQALQSLAGVSQTLSAQSCSDGIMKAFQQFDEGSVKDPSEITVLATALQPLIPPKPAVVRIVGPVRLELLQRLLLVSTLFVKAWPNETLYDLAGFLLARLEVAQDPPFENESDNQLSSQSNKSFTMFRRLQGWWKHIQLWKQQLPMTSELVEDAQMKELGKKLIVYHKFFGSSQFDPETLEGKARSTFDSALQETVNFTSEFKSFFVSNVDAPLRTSLKSLDSQKGGAPDGGLWTDNVQDAMTFKAFLKATELTLRSIKKVELVTLIKSCDSVHL